MTSVGVGGRGVMCYLFVDKQDVLFVGQVDVISSG